MGFINNTKQGKDTRVPMPNGNGSTVGENMAKLRQVEAEAAASRAREDAERAARRNWAGGHY